MRNHTKNNKVINLIVCWICVVSVWICNAQTITSLSGIGTIPITSITDLYQVKDQQVQVAYTVTSLSQAKNQFAQGNVNFIVTQAPLLPSEHTQDPCSGAWDVREFPLNVDGLILIYTIPGIYTQNASSSAPRLILDRQSIVDIYSGVITNWNHPRIISLNPRLASRLQQVPADSVITPYYIQDSSLSQVFSAALSSFNNTWAAQQAAVGPNGWPYNATAIDNAAGDGASRMRSTILGSYSAIGFVQYSADTSLVNAQIANRAGNVVAYSASTATSAANDYSASVQASLRATEARSSDYPNNSLMIVDGPGQNSWPLAHLNMITTRVKGFSDCLKSGKMISLLQFVRTSEVGTLFTKVQQGLLTDFNVAINDLTSTIRCCQSASGGGSVTKISIQGEGTAFGSVVFGRVAAIFNTVPTYTATVSYSPSSSSVQDILTNASNTFALSASSPGLGGSFHSLQLFGGSVVCVYNAQGVSSLSLTRQQMIGIFSGTITSWSDLSSSYPNQAITRILEADPDVSSIFSSALQFTSVFTTSTQDTTISRLSQTPFSIGIVGLNSNVFSNISVARFTAGDGSTLSPSNTSAITASLAGAATGIWPITSFVWVTFKVDSSSFCTSVNNLAQFIYWTATDPQALSSLEGSLSVRPASASNTGSTLAAITCSSTAILNPILVVPGAGSSFAAGVYQSWLSTYAFIDASVRFTYNPTGSGNGISSITAKTVIWAGSDAALTATQATAGGDLQMYPAFAGSVVLAYRIDQIPRGSPPLNLTRELIVDIYLGNVRMWNDPRIVELNSAVAQYLPEAPIVLVYRSDSSGTTNIFSTALRAFSSAWTISPANSIAWPVPGITAEGSSGMGLRIFSTANTLGYVELSYAAVNGLSYSHIRNKAGNWVSPTSAAVQSAMTDFKDSFLPDFTCSIVDGPGAGSWPLSAYTYLILHSRTMTDLNTARKMLQFILWAVSEDVPSQRVQDLGFTPLSETFVQQQLIPKLQDVEVNGVSVLGRPEKPKHNKSSVAVALGVGLGLGLPLVLIVILFFLYTRHVKRKKVVTKGGEIFTIEADEWADEGVELQPLNDSMGIRIGNGSELFRFGIPKGTRFPVNQTLIEKIQLVNESSTDKNFAFYVPHDENRFKLVLVPGYGVLKPGAEMTVEARFTLMMTTTISRKVKFEVLGCGEQQIVLQLAGDVSTRLDPNEIDILGKPIGQGAFGTVYRGTYRGTQVAVKVLARQNELLKAQTDEFLKEIDLMHKLRSPFIVGFIGASYVPGKLCVLTEYMERGSVAHMLRKIKIEHALRLKIALDCALAMSFLHNNGVMHRDLKPANLLVASLSSSAEVTIKLADFGTSRTCTQIYLEGRHTNGWGTPGYMAPELLSRGEYSGKVDVYAFGIMLLELWTQKDPFAFMKKIWDLPDYIVGGNRPEIPEDAPVEYVALITKCWAANPADRPTFPELVVTLEPLYATERARAKENKRKLVEAGITPTKTVYENGTYHSRGSNSSAGVPLSNTQAETINLSDFSFSEDTNTRTGTLDPMRMTQRDHTRSATTDVMRAMLTNPLANRGKERVIGVTGMTGGPHSNMFYGTNGPHSPMYSSRNPHFPPMSAAGPSSMSSAASGASSNASSARFANNPNTASSGAGIISPAPSAARIGEKERFTSLANLSNDNISDDRQNFFNQDHP